MDADEGEGAAPAAAKPAPVAALREGISNAELQQWMTAFRDTTGNAIFSAVRGV